MKVRHDPRFRPIGRRAKKAALTLAATEDDARITNAKRGNGLNRLPDGERPERDPCPMTGPSLLVADVLRDRSVISAVRSSLAGYRRPRNAIASAEVRHLQDVRRAAADGADQPERREPPKIRTSAIADLARFSGDIAAGRGDRPACAATAALGWFALAAISISITFSEKRPPRPALTRA